MAGALASLGVDRALLVAGEDGLDEVSATAPTRVVEVNGEEISSYLLDAGRSSASRLAAPSRRRAGRRQENAAVTRAILTADADAPVRPAGEDLALVNAGAAIYAAGRADSIAEGVEAARAALDGRARRPRARALRGRQPRARPRARRVMSAPGTVLERILAADPRRSWSAAARDVPRGELERLARRAPASSRSLLAALSGREIGVIAEFKRRSPSAGALAGDPRLEDVVGAYERGGAAALSILTEGPNFGGSLHDLRAARRACGLPLLRKDFIVDEYQLLEARAGGRRRRAPDRRGARRRTSCAPCARRRRRSASTCSSRSMTRASSSARSPRAPG